VGWGGTEGGGGRGGKRGGGGIIGVCVYSFQRIPFVLDLETNFAGFFVFAGVTSGLVVFYCNVFCVGGCGGVGKGLWGWGGGGGGGKGGKGGGVGGKKTGFF